MERFFSKIDPSILLHCVFRAKDFATLPGRIDLMAPENFLQLSVLKMANETTFRPHVHVWKKVEPMAIAQESWVVIRGRVKCIFYDSDNKTILAEPILGVGDASITLLGGHNYRVMEDNTYVYEFKTGPYTGIDNDKKFI